MGDQMISTSKKSIPSLQNDPDDENLPWQENADDLLEDEEEHSEEGDFFTPTIPSHETGENKIKISFTNWWAYQSKTQHTFQPRIIFRTSAVCETIA